MLTLLSAQLCLVPALAAVSLGRDGSLLVTEPGALRAVDPKGAESWKVVIDAPYINGSFCQSIADEPLVTQSTSASGTLFATVGPLPLDSFCGGLGIYVNNSVLALNSQDGSLKWNVSVPCRVRGGQYTSPYCAGTPVLAGDIVYVHVAAPVSRGNGYIVALDAEDGTLLWNVSTGGTRHRLDPKVLAQGTVLLAGINGTDAQEHSQNETHLALWPNGTQRWRRTDLGYGAKTQARGSGATSTIYMVSADNLWALAEDDGHVLWSRWVPGAAAPIVAEGSSMLYLYSYARPYGARGAPANVTAFNVDGELRWVYDMAARPDPRLSPTPEFSISTGEDGIDTLHFSNASVLLALREGQKLWEVDLMNGSVCSAQYCSFSAPTVVHDGTVLAFGGAPGKDVPDAMHAVRDGQHMWSLESTDHDHFQVPVLGDDGVTYVPEFSYVRPGQPGGVLVSAVDSTGAVLWVDSSEQAAVLV